MRTAIRTAIRKLGNSSGVIIPKSMLAEAGIDVGDAVDTTLEDSRIVMAPVKRRPRGGWAEAFAEIAELGDEDLAWLQFRNEGDDELPW
jgi:antitoxin MazE